jgi:hypothetical protein
VVECQLCNYETLSSKPQTHQKKGEQGPQLVTLSPLGRALLYTDNVLEMFISERK